MKPCPQCGALEDEGTRYCAQCGASLEGAQPDPLIGRTVGGAYLLQELIGVGGMGRVYRAEQNMLGRTVAVKVIHPHLLGDDQTVARFYNEARAASRLNHPNSVSIIDFGRTEDGILYLVMEHLAGKDLSHILAEEGPLPFARICRILRNVLSALGEAHVLGVIHRDLKPENVILRRVRRGAEQIKVVDFGLAHIVGPGGTAITTPGLVCGTPDYMAPEQCRGENVDGRGDLYALGVVLFEMLTDQLPFEGDTPAKVVFKHVHDPIPDPREIAPHRAIPDDLAAICIKALQKKPEARYQSADELYEALGGVEGRLDVARNAVVATCVSCGTQNPADQRFCGACGARLTDRFTVPPSFRSAPSRTAAAAPTGSILIGRSEELARLLELREVAREASTCVRLLGEAGVGKTYLLAELGRQLSDAGDLVVTAGPHPSGAPVPYWPIRALVRTLLEVDDAGLGKFASGDLLADPIASAGISELLDPRGLEGLPGESRAEAVSVALAAAIRVGHSRAQSGLVTMILDDLYRCDSLSATVLRRLMGRRQEGGLFIVAASSLQGDPLEGAPSVRMAMRGLDPPESAALVSGQPEDAARDGGSWADRPAPRAGQARSTGRGEAAARSAGPSAREADTIPGARLLLPLYLEQLRALGISALDGDEVLPPRLADAVVARLERLDASARRLLQVVAVLGDSVAIDAVRELSRGTDLGAIDVLVREGLITVAHDRVLFCHPFVRELVECSIPAEHRKELHAQALQVTAASGAPLEERAEHAWRAGEPMSALLLLERMGDAALRRGDGSAAVLAFRRGLELARRELLFTGDTALDCAIVTFSRKLGDALDRAGDTAGADGVLREALELAPPVSRERGRMLLLLSRVAAKRDKHREATRLLGQALELAIRQGDRLGEAEAHLALGKLRLADGDALAAANTLLRAIELGRAHKGAEPLLVEAALVRAAALRSAEDVEGAGAHLELARAAAQQSGAGALVARVLAAQAAAADEARERERALRFYREAAQAAARAGDAEGSRRWEHLGQGTRARQTG